MIEKGTELIIPVYLNQRIVFDLIAMLQDGMSTVTRVSASETAKATDNRRYGAAFGLSQAFSSLLKIDVSGERNKSNESASGVQRNEERVHTPSSLFHKLRSILIDKKQLTGIESDHRPLAGQIVEFSTLLRRNPIIQVLDTFMGLLDMVDVFEDKPKVRGSKGSQQTDYRKIKLQMEKLADNVKSGETIDIVSETLPSGHKAVITLEEEFLNDPVMSDLVDGQFKVVGKIIRVISDSSSSVSLLRKAPVGVINKDLLLSAFSMMSTAAHQGNIQIPQIEWEIAGPVIQVIPVAIFA